MTRLTVSLVAYHEYYPQSWHTNPHEVITSSYRTSTIWLVDIINTIIHLIIYIIITVQHNLGAQLYIIDLLFLLYRLRDLLN